MDNQVAITLSPTATPHANIRQCEVSRNINVDFIKVIAMFYVVGLHTFFGGDKVSYIFYSISVAAIPLFFMVSGYLLLGRSESSYGYSIRKVIGIWKYILFTVITFSAVCFIYGLLTQNDVWLLTKIFIASSVLDPFCSVWQRGPFSVYWYLGAMMIIYLLYPLILKLYKKRKTYLSILGILLVVECVVFMLNVLYGFETGIRQPLRIWNWLFYFMLGGAMHRINVNRITIFKILIMIFGSCLLYVPAICHLVWAKILSFAVCEYWYSCPLVMVYSTGIFLLILKLKIKNDGWMAWIIGILSTVFLPVYSYHGPIIRFLWQYMTDGPWLFVSTASLSVLLGLLIMRIPLVNKFYRI